MKGKRKFETDRRRGHIEQRKKQDDNKAEIGVMWPHIKKSYKPLEAGKGKEQFSPSNCPEREALMISDVWLPEL